MDVSTPEAQRDHGEAVADIKERELVYPVTFVDCTLEISGGRQSTVAASSFTMFWPPWPSSASVYVAVTVSVAADTLQFVNRSEVPWADLRLTFGTVGGEVVPVAEGVVRF